MRPTIGCLCLTVIIIYLAGCGPGSEPREESPLTLEEWKQLPVQTKYEIETLERLKQGNPKLQDQRTWDRFTRTVLLPGKQKEMQVKKSH